MDEILLTNVIESIDNEVEWLEVAYTELKILCSPAHEQRGCTGCMKATYFDISMQRGDVNIWIELQRSLPRDLWWRVYLSRRSCRVRWAARELTTAFGRLTCCFWNKNCRFRLLRSIVSRSSTSICPLPPPNPDMTVHRAPQDQQRLCNLGRIYWSGSKDVPKFFKTSTPTPPTPTWTVARS